MSFDTLEKIINSRNRSIDDEIMLYDFQNAYINRSYNKNPAAIKQNKHIMMEAYEICELEFEKYMRDAGESIYDFNNNGGFI